MASLQLQARALGDPTRHEIFRFAADAARPVDVAELTAHLGINHNAVRQHLSKLVEARLLVEETAPPEGRGRPRLRFSVHPGADSRWGVAGPYERLALWLAEIVRTGDTPFEVGRRVGRREHLRHGAASDPLDVLVGAMARHGFDPAVGRTGADVDIALRACPFVTTAIADPDTVCKLHFGIATGIADSAGGIIIDELIPEDPRRANCRLRCHFPADDPHPILSVRSPR